jgi:hypothetical protein
MFVTVLYGVLDRTSRRFHYVRAGHVLPILCHADGTVITPPASLGQPLGVLPDASLDEHSILLPPNSTLVLCPFDNDETDICQLGEAATLDEERAVARLIDNTSPALVEIPAGFEESLQAGEPVSIVYRSNENAAAPSYILQAAQAVVQQMGGALVAAQVGVNTVDGSGVVEFADEAERAAFWQGVYDRAAELWAQDPVTIDFRESVQATSSAPSGAQRGFGQSIPGMGSMFVMFTVLTSLYVLIRSAQPGRSSG